MSCRTRINFVANAVTLACLRHQLAWAVQHADGGLTGLRGSGGLGVSGYRSRDFGLVARRDNLCAEGRQLPELYLLGAQKCATTTFAEDMVSLGIDNAGTWKEFHFFDKFWNGPNPSSDAEFELQRKAWLEMLPECETKTRRVLADYTPSNLRLVPLPSGTRPTGTQWGLWFLDHNSTDEVENAARNPLNLPFALRSVYGEEGSKRLTLVVLLRDPLARMQSAWYAASERTEDDHTKWQQCHDCKAHSFTEALDRTVKRAERMPPVYDDWLWTSMYARHLDAWLAHFGPEQLYVVPYKLFVEGGASRTRVCWDIMRRLDYPANCTKLQTSDSVSNAHPHPPIEDEKIPRDTLQRFKHIMKAENDLLITLLTEAWSHGSVLAHFNGVSGSPEEVKAWLEDGWA